jgi:anti-sigma factor RsiW
MRDNQLMNQEHLSEDVLNMYLDGELSGGERDRVEVHLAVCDACRVEFSALQQLFVALDELVPARAPDLVPRVLSRIESPLPQPRMPASRLRPLPWLTAALQAIAMMALLAWGWRQLTDQWSMVNDSFLPEAVNAAWSQASVWAQTQWTAISAWPSTAWAEVQAWLTRLSTSADLPLPLNQVAVLGVALVFVWLLGNVVLLRRAMLNGHIHTQRRY